jgi:hypothetical protein
MCITQQKHIRLATKTTTLKENLRVLVADVIGAASGYRKWTMAVCHSPIFNKVKAAKEVCGITFKPVPSALLIPAKRQYRFQSFPKPAYIRNSYYHHYFLQAQYQ